MKRRAEEGVRLHRPLTLGLAQRLFAVVILKVPQKKCASTQDTKKRGLGPPNCGTYIWRQSVKRCGSSQDSGSAKYRPEGCQPLMKW